MPGFLVVHANVHQVALLLEFGEGNTLSFSKLCWLSGSRYVHHARSLSARRLLNYAKNRRGLASTALILPKASFSIESQAHNFPEYWQNTNNVFENEASAAAKLLPNLIPSHLSSVNIADGLLHDFSSIPIEITIAAVAAVVGTMLGYLVAALPTSRKGEVQKEGSSNMEPLGREWLLVMKSTPFNRFVMMRCPSIVFEDENAHEGLSKKLSTKGQHVIKLCNYNADWSYRNDVNGLGKSTDSNEDGEWDGSFLRFASKVRPQKEDFTSGYQRDFLHTEDGGVLAVDWPSHLELSGEHGLDTTVVLIPGSADGSEDKGIQELVKTFVKCGYFPIVLNPRGCGGSPLTTPRLFTAGDSDDVRTAVQFVLKSRPWATIMAIGCGYGANMLVKYLGEEAAPTPLTAAVCVDNIFNLEEFSCLNEEDHDTSLYQRARSGYVQILKSNQMVFQGKKEFDLRKGLLASSLKDFDKAICMVSKGYNDVQEFYKDSSSKSWVNNVKVPVFYIQGTQSAQKTCSISAHVFEDNPFTTLIFHNTTSNPSSQTMSSGLYKSLMVEWLAAVEMAFLKGRHPLLQDLDVTFQPPQPKGRSALQDSTLNGEELTMRNIGPLTGIRRGGSSTRYFPSVNYTEGNLKEWNRDNSIELNAPNKESNALVNTSKDVYGVDVEKLRREGDSESDEDSQENDDESATEQGQVRQAAESILKVLDVTMPGTLSEKQKEEVLEAVGRGETLVTALQEACPEDVREKMTTAVSAAVQARGMSLKLAGFGKSIPAPKIPDGMVEKIQEKLNSVVPNKLPAGFTDDTAKTPVSDNTAHSSNEVVEHGDQSKFSNQNEGHKSLVQESSDAQQPESSGSSHAGQNGNGAAMEQVNKSGTEVEERVHTPGQVPDTEKQNKSAMESKVTEQAKGDNTAKPASNDSRTNQGDTIQSERHDDPSPHEDKTHEGQDQNQESLGAASQTAETPQTEKKSDSTTSSEDHDKKSPDPNLGDILAPQVPSQDLAAPPLPSIDMSRAFEALTGVDDSTQMAVANVFGVIENVIEKLEKEQGQKDELLEHPSSPEHRSSSLQVSHNKHSTGVTNRSQNLQVEPFGDNSGGQQIPKIGNDESKRKLDEIGTPTNANREIDKGFEKEKLRNVHSCPVGSPSASTGLENDPTLGMDQEPDDADLALEYFEDENVWKFIDGTSNTKAVSGTQDDNRTEKLEKHSHNANTNLEPLTDMEKNHVILPEYMVVGDQLKDPEQSFSAGNIDEMHSEFASESCMADSMQSATLSLQKKVQELVINALEKEVLRRSGNSILDPTLQQDIEKVGIAVADTVERSMQLRWLDFTDDKDFEKISEDSSVQVTGRAEKMHVQLIVSAINEVYGKIVTLPSLLPAGVLFGVVLAALSPLDMIGTDDAQDSRELVHIHREDFRRNASLIQSCQKTDSIDSNITNFNRPSKRPFLIEQSYGFTENGVNIDLNSGKEEVERGFSWQDINNSGVADACKNELAEDPSAEKASPTSNNMMGAVAAAMGASAAIASQAPSSDNVSNPSKHEQQKAGSQASSNAVGNFGCGSGGEEVDSDDSKASIVSTLAEKAMSVAAPVVPTKEDGGVDHERLVEILAGLGQKGGILRFIGKIALLWGGLRGAMSLTDRLLVFLHMSDRPLYQRLLGFILMAVLMWSPVLVPLLPSLLQQWASRSPNGVASTAALIGLYGSVVILITIWGRKIRGYEDALQQYGISIEPTFNVQSLMSGLALGLSLMASVYLLGVSFDMIQLNWAPSLSLNSSNSFLWNVVSCWRIFKLLVQCFGVNLAVSFVEELCFRSWLQEEISTDLGFHRAAALSGLAFSISHWSLPVMPGLWLLSLVLTGIKVRRKGDLSLGIGIHAGLMAGLQLINIGCEVKYRANASLWFVGHQTGDPFTGLIGISILGVLALLFYPWGYNREDKR